MLTDKRGKDVYQFNQRYSCAISNRQAKNNLCKSVSSASSAFYGTQITQIEQIVTDKVLKETA